MDQLLGSTIGESGTTQVQVAIAHRLGSNADGLHLWLSENRHGEENHENKIPARFHARPLDPSSTWTGFSHECHPIRHI